MDRSRIPKAPKAGAKPITIPKAYMLWFKRPSVSSTQKAATATNATERTAQKAAKQAKAVQLTKQPRNKRKHSEYAQQANPEETKEEEDNGLFVRDSTHRVPVVQTRKEKRALARSPMFYHRRDTTRSPPPEPYPSPKRTLRSTDKTQPAVVESSGQPAQKRARFADRVSETTAVVNTTPTAGTQSLPA